MDDFWLQLNNQHNPKIELLQSQQQALKQLNLASDLLEDLKMFKIAESVTKLMQTIKIG